jgi:uncharacterized protein with NRDE domain
MCIILLAHQVNPDYPLIVAANRDEFYGRPTLAAGFWMDAPDTLAGRDLERGGTWLGVTRTGRIAAVTNYRESAPKSEDALSRGHLVSNFLNGSEGPEEYLSGLSSSAGLYAGFNLIVGGPVGLFYFSNRGGVVPQPIAPGIHGLSNHLLDTPWPKVERGRRALGEIAKRSGELSVEDIFKVLADDARASDEDLPETGVGVELERVLSPVFISTKGYGTRSSTVLAFNRNGEALFVERSFNQASIDYEEVRYEFSIRSL